VENRKGKCKDVAFFQSRDGGFWSPKFGTLKEPSEKGCAATKPKPKPTLKKR